MDSSINTALFSALAKGAVKTFSLGFKEREKYNELPYAKRIAEIFKTEHHEILIDGQDVLNFLPELAYYQDEPIADPVCVPFYYVSKLAADNKMKVCHVGEGGDELFCGYPSWMSILNLYRFNALTPDLVKKTIFEVLGILGNKDSYKYEFLRRAVNQEPIFWSGSEAFLENKKQKLISQRLRKKFRNYSSAEVVAKYYRRFSERSKDKSALNWMSYIDLRFRLPELLLMRVDKMSMAVSIETRVPFLDHELVEFIMSIPQSIRIKGNESKYILKKCAASLLPKDIIYRRKQGFGAPVNEWLSTNRLGNFVKKKLTDFCNDTDFFDQRPIQKMLTEKEHDWSIWFLLNFAMWYEKWF